MSASARSQLLSIVPDRPISAASTEKRDLRNSARTDLGGHPSADRGRIPPQPTRRSPPPTRHVRQSADKAAAAMCAVPWLQPSCWRAGWPTSAREAGAPRAPQGPLHRPTSAGSGPAQAAKRPQDPTDAEAAVAEGRPVRWHPRIARVPALRSQKPLSSGCVP